MGLDERVWTLLNHALELYRDSPRASAWLRQQRERFAEPLRVAVVGRAKAGKSTLVNALAGEEIAPIELTGGGQAFTWYTDGATPKAMGYAPHGPPRELAVARKDRALHIDQWQLEARLDRIVVDWPSRALRDLTLIDTPADELPVNAASHGPGATDTADAGGAVLDRACAEADAVLYLTRQVPGQEAGALAAVRDHPVAAVAPVSTILVLSRADELGGGRIDALTSAKQLARRYRRDPRVAGLCQNVVSVAGLIAQAGRTLREAEFATLAALAALPKNDLDAFLLSADRFAGATFPVQLDQELRRGLLDRFGIFGLRLTTALIRQGCRTQPKLAAELAQRSGLTELRDSVERCFTDRREVLKARSALIALDVVLRMEPRPGSGRLLTDLERLLAGAHEFQELRLLAALQAGRITLPDGLAEQAQRLLGGAGTDLVARLGMDYEPSAPELAEVVLHTLAQWQQQAENPMLDNDQRDAARGVVRSCEGMLEQLRLAGAAPR